MYSLKLEFGQDIEVNFSLGLLMTIVRTSVLHFICQMTPPALQHAFTQYQAIGLVLTRERVAPMYYVHVLCHLHHAYSLKASHPCQSCQ